ncbi:MAG: hypothetical protein WAO24_05265 [Peptococcia bacterium]
MAKRIILIIVIVLVVIMVPLFWAARTTGFNVQALLSKLPITSMFIEAPPEAEPVIVPISPLETENKELQGQIRELQEQIGALENENNQLKSENEEIKREITDLRAEILTAANLKANAQYTTELYKDMKPADIVKILDNMDDEKALLILTELEPNQASKILALMDPQRAALLTKLLLE